MTAIADEANARFPEEACGFVLGDGTIVACTNTAEDPQHDFLIDPVEAERWWGTGDVVAVWHSHCFDPAVPSERDEELAVAGLEHWVYSVLDEDLQKYVLKEGKLVNKPRREGWDWVLWVCPSKNCDYEISQPPMVGGVSHRCGRGKRLVVMKARDQV